MRCSCGSPYGLQPIQRNRNSTVYWCLKCNRTYLIKKKKRYY